MHGTITGTYAAWMNGWEAYETGRTNNPHKQGTILAGYWLDGYAGRPYVGDGQ